MTKRRSLRACVSRVYFLEAGLLLAVRPLDEVGPAVLPVPDDVLFGSGAGVIPAISRCSER